MVAATMPDRWPDFLLAGPPRAATTTLYQYLDQHPGIYMPPLKEPHFFTDRRQRTWRDDDPDPDRREAYLQLFEAAGPDQLAGEASTSYLWYPEAAGRIRRYVPEARFVVPLRDPVERAWSHYLKGWDRPDGDPSIREAIAGDVDLDGTFLDASRYARHVRRYLETFGEDRVEVVLLPDLRRETERVLRRIVAFLGADPDAVRAIDTDLRANVHAEGLGPVASWVHTNRTLRRWARQALPLSARRWIVETFLAGSGDKPPLGEADRRALQQLYAPDLDELEELLGRDVSALRRDWI